MLVDRFMMEPDDDLHKLVINQLSTEKQTNMSTFFAMAKKNQMIGSDESKSTETGALL